MKSISVKATRRTPKSLILFEIRPPHHVASRNGMHNMLANTTTAIVTAPAASNIIKPITEMVVTKTVRFARVTATAQWMARLLDQFDGYARAAPTVRDLLTA